jgi:hypothetical protein
VLDDERGLLGDVELVQPHPLHQLLHGLRLLTSGLESYSWPLWASLNATLYGVVPQHVEDETFLDGLLHRVQVEGLRQSPTLGHTAKQL